MECLCDEFMDDSGGFCDLIGVVRWSEVME